MIRVAINGFGRIGRLVFRIMEEDPNFEVVAINDLTDAEQLAYLLKYDTSHGNYRVNEISFEDNFIIVGDRKIRVYAETDPANLPWKELNIDEAIDLLKSELEKGLGNPFFNRFAFLKTLAHLFFINKLPKPV